MNKPVIATIVETTVECRDVKTFKFEFPRDVEPGQFFMIWIPQVDEIPMSVSFIDKKIKGITFRRIGEATDMLFNLDVGDKIGVRGPYGNGFTITGEHILFVGGGTGIAMLAPAVEKARENHITASVILGVKNQEELFFEQRMNACGANVYISTDDGSKGFKGSASDLALKLLSKNKYSAVLTCGPELMMKQLLEKCETTTVSFQASLERYMKCGVGICGQCCIGNGFRVCVEGPVFNGNILKDFEDFGRYKRDAAGRKIYFQKNGMR